tara:strand:+ start:576 stop:806 length:231 start_codon:yes stop_codon:yes gene_type:complete
LREILALAVEELTSLAFKLDWLNEICEGMSVACAKRSTKEALIYALRDRVSQNHVVAMQTSALTLLIDNSGRVLHA